MKKQTAQPSELTVTLRIIVVSPMAGVAYGVQEGKGTGYKVSLLQISTDRDLVFDIQVQVKQLESGQPNFVGPVAQGPPAARFVYLNIGKSAGQAASTWNRRLKVPLMGITSAMVERAALEKRVLQAKFPGRAKDGGPSCATVQPTEGWQVSDRQPG